MSWQPPQASVKRCFIAPSGHSFAVYCACAGAAEAVSASASKAQPARVFGASLIRIGLSSLEGPSVLSRGFRQFGAKMMAAAIRNQKRAIGRNLLHFVVPPRGAFHRLKPGLCPLRNSALPALSI